MCAGVKVMGARVSSPCLHTQYSPHHSLLNHMPAPPCFSTFRCCTCPPLPLSTLPCPPPPSPPQISSLRTRRLAARVLYLSHPVEITYEGEGAGATASEDRHEKLFAKPCSAVNADLLTAFYTSWTLRPGVPEPDVRFRPGEVVAAGRQSQRGGGGGGGGKGARGERGERGRGGEGLSVIREGGGVVGGRGLVAGAGSRGEQQTMAASSTIGTAVSPDAAVAGRAGGVQASVPEAHVGVTQAGDVLDAEEPYT